jgi:hypothetical protein
MAVKVGTDPCPDRSHLLALSEIDRGIRARGARVPVPLCVCTGVCECEKF